MWDDGGLDPDLFCGEVLIDCNECDVTGQMLLTFPLQEHDLMVGPMPTPAPKFLLVKNKKSNVGSSIPTLPIVPPSDKKEEDKEEEKSLKGLRDVGVASFEEVVEDLGVFCIFHCVIFYQKIAC